MGTLTEHVKDFKEDVTDAMRRGDTATVGTVTGKDGRPVAAAVSIRGGGLPDGMIAMMHLPPRAARGFAVELLRQAQAVEDAAEAKPVPKGAN